MHSIGQCQKLRLNGLQKSLIAASRQVCTTNGFAENRVACKNDLVLCVVIADAARRMARRSKAFKFHAAQGQHVAIMHQKIGRLILHLMPNKEGQVAAGIEQAVCVRLTNINRRTSFLTHLRQTADVVAVTMRQADSNNLNLQLLSCNQQLIRISARIENYCLLQLLIHDKIAVCLQHADRDSVYFHKVTSGKIIKLINKTVVK